MTEATHTPGPWEVGTSPVRNTLFVGSADAWICGELDNPNTPLETGEALANARLIAAAPDMLEALKVYGDYERYVVPPPFGHECQWCGDCVSKMNDMRRAAIRKATGAQ